MIKVSSRQYSHTTLCTPLSVIPLSNPKDLPDPPGSTGSTRIHLVDPRIHLPNLTFIDVLAFWPTFIYIILKLHPPSNSFRILWGAGGWPIPSYLSLSLSELVLESTGRLAGGANKSYEENDRESRFVYLNKLENLL